MPKGVNQASGRISHPSQGGLLVRRAATMVNGGWVVRGASSGAPRPQQVVKPSEPRRPEAA